MSCNLSGRELAGFIKERQAHQVRGLIQHFRVQPKLAIIQTNTDVATNLYTRLKKAYGEDIRIIVDLHKIQQDNVANLIERLNNDTSVTGIVVQLPMANISETDRLVNLIAPKKDVDGLGKSAKWDSATATAINWLMAGYNINLIDKKIAVVGQGRLVGAPLTKMWRNSGLEITTIDNTCSDLAAALIDMDVIVTATGVPGLITGDMLKRGAIVVDAGVADVNGRAAGDLDPTVYNRDDLILTPPSGGVGPLTIAALMDNVIRTSYTASQN